MYTYRDIKLTTRSNLVEIDYKKKRVVFEELDKPGVFHDYHVNMTVS